MLKVVLVRPETPGNVGAVARSMKNFGFENLVLVDPCEMTEEADKRAKHAKDVLKDAEVWDRMNWDSFDITVSTSSETGGDYNVRRNAVSPGVLRKKLEDTEGTIGLVFGPESKGLRNEEVDGTDFLCHIPASDDYPVFNLSHAVAIILYELSERNEDTSYELASSKEKDVLMEQLNGIIEKVGIEEYRHEPLKQSLENVFGRAMLARREANTLIGFFRRVRENIASE
ncbi:MAG: RNA methyltransferase [Candidatus Aenigmatarchaeota archaeon]